jgi:hypothetical protein
LDRDNPATRINYGSTESLSTKLHKLHSIILKFKLQYILNLGCIFKSSMTWRSVVIQALCYKLEGRGFETRWGEQIFPIYLILLAALGSGVYSASNRNEY